MGHLTKIATCTLRQQALDFIGNRDRIIESIRIAKQQGARFRVGPELEISGYGCWDHFLEGDTFLHSWQSLSVILQSNICENIICDIGMPIVHRNVRYNCRVIVLNNKILMIRPKMVMADSGNYHESRYFAMWPRGRLEEHYLPRVIRNTTGQLKVPFGEAILATMDTCIGFEICEEFFVSNCPHSSMALVGVEIFSNGSASHHEIGKFQRKLTLLKSAMSKSGGIYLYSNNIGCDGDRMYYDGGSVIISNGDLISVGGLFSMEDVIVTTATVDLEEVRTYRGLIQSMANQAQYIVNYERITVDFSLSLMNDSLSCTLPILNYPEMTSSEEISLGPPLWLLDYLLKSGCKSFFLPLSGGLDSMSVALVVYRLSELLSQECTSRREGRIVEFVKNVLQPADCDVPSICNRLLVTAYMSTANSTDKSKELARKLASSIGSKHFSFGLDTIVDSILGVIKGVLNFWPKYKGGNISENLALQNVQARIRMVISYSLAQLIPVALDRPGPMLVLATANASETLRGYFTKYDNSSGDLNPIGSLDKEDLQKFAIHLTHIWPNLKPAIDEILKMEPSAELIPQEFGPQLDEIEMGLSYADLSLLGYLRNIKRLGPHSMTLKLAELRPGHDLIECSELVRKFYHYYSVNRHKTASLPPTYHAKPTSSDDNRFDMRPLLYPCYWTDNCTSDLHDGGLRSPQ